MSGATAVFPPPGGISDPAFVRLPDPGAVFGRRAERLRELAHDHPLGPYLGFLAGIAAAQQRAVDLLEPPPPLAEQVLEQRLANAMPPLAKEDLAADESLAELLERLPSQAERSGAPAAAEQARRRFLGLSRPERIALAEAVATESYPPDQLGEALYAAAGLQTYLHRRAAALDPASIKPVADGVCPVCGGPPVASVIVGWAKADRARYCCCALCGTLWNYVRIKCTACSSTAEISYFRIEEQSEDIAAETCGACQSYIKHFHQHRAAAIEPLADDIASFGLDLLLREKGFHRVAANPFMVAG